MSGCAMFHTELGEKKYLFGRRDGIQKHRRNKYSLGILFNVCR